MDHAVPVALPQRILGRLERPGCALHYEVTGSGPALIFMHGLGGNHLSWFQQVAHFAPTHTCITLSARGFAPSLPLPSAPDPADFAGDLAALIAHLNLAEVTLIGQSMGGWGAIDYAIQHPGTVAALVLAATTGTIDPNKITGPEHTRLAPWQDHASRSAQACAAQGIHVAAGVRMAAEQPAMHLLYRHIDDMNAGLDKLTLRQRLWAARVRPPSDLNGARCPILFISGGEDIVIPPFAADAIARDVPGARVAHIADAGHSAYFERPAIFNRTVSDFLKG